MSSIRNKIKYQTNYHASNFLPILIFLQKNHFLLRVDAEGHNLHNFILV